MKQLAICGKTIDLSNFAGKSSAQFRDQLRRNGVEMEDSQFELLFEQLTKSVERAAKKAAETKEK